MKIAEHERRWSDPSFLSGMHDLLNSVLVLRKPAQNLDLRGLILGLDGAPGALLNADLQDADLKNADLSQSRLSCAFSRASMQETRFEETLFDTCRLKSATFRSCSFDRARLDSPTLDDAVFVECSFNPNKTHRQGDKRIRCHRSLENQPRRVEMNRPLNFYNPNEHFRSKKLPSRALRGVSWNENANLRKFAGRIISTLAGRIVVTADTCNQITDKTQIAGRHRGMII